MCRSTSTNNVSVFFSFCLGFSPVDVARGRRVQTVLRGVLIYFDTVCCKNLLYLKKLHVTSYYYGLLFERAITFVNFFLIYFLLGFQCLFI